MAVLYILETDKVPSIDQKTLDPGMVRCGITSSTLPLDEHIDGWLVEVAGSRMDGRGDLTFL